MPRLRDLRYAAIARRHGLRSALRAIEEARATDKIGPALALAMLEKESGGRNVFGHDPTIFVGAGKVTETKYVAYRRARRASGNTKMQGVGPLQLTWWGTQDAADRVGGCWKPRINIRVGLRLLDSNIRAYGLYDGIRRYNGSGLAAERYAKDVLAKRDVWRRRLGIR